jgi:hypothetical protein
MSFFNFILLQKNLYYFLQDYEVVDGEDNGEWDKEIEDLLEEES